MDKKQIQLLNRKVKSYEKHPEISIILYGETIECVFERFISFEYETVTFSIKSKDGKRHVICHDYNTARTIHPEYSCVDVECADLFSRRHLRSFLFYAWDFYQHISGGYDELNTAIHIHYPVPILRTETRSGKKHWFKVDSAVIKNQNIVMEGILTMAVSSYISSPIKASCTYNTGKGMVSWKYKQNGRIVKENEEETVLYESPIKPEHIFYEAAKISNKKVISGELTSLSPYTVPVLTKLKDFTFRMIMRSKTGMGLYDVPHFIICGINEVTDTLIEFSICDGDRPYTQLWYNRTRKQIHIHRRMNTNMSPAKNQFIFVHESDGCEKKFNEMLRLIEKEEKKLISK